MAGQSVAARLVAARDPRAKAVAVDDAELPKTLAQAYRVQAEVVRLTDAGGWGRAIGRPWGWKVAAASAGALRWHKIAEPIRGRMFSGGLMQS
ncbi:MAG TPA: hypothetical protein VJL84_05885, partial [Kiloniellales bacterium]|nr:hypothetical protein [Kiloniellales bacterium]